ncbi:WG repeat-containing protein [Fertoeibacter niger]|nr:WG repeat-containing protein [Fertoeibacter niger]
MPFRALRPALALMATLLPHMAQAENAFRWVVEPAFDDAGSAHRGVVPLQQGGLWGLMGPAGQWIVPPSFQAVGAAGDGRFAVQQRGLWGAVDLAGQVVIPVEFEAIGTPAEITPVRWQGQWYALNRDGSAQDVPLAIDTLAGNAGTCITGTAGGIPVLENRGVEPALHQPEGIDRIFGPSEGFAVAVAGDKRGFLDCEYGVMIGGVAEYDEARRMAEGLAAVRDGDLWGYTGPYGSYEIDPRFPAAREFAEGVAPAQDAGGLWGYVDRVGRWKIAPQFDQAYSFADGIAGVQVGELRGFITPDGAFAADPQFQDFWRHDGGVVPVQTGDLWGIIAPDATDPATRLNLPLADLAASLQGRAPRYDLVPSAPHWYFAQDIVSMHSLHISADARVMVTVLNNGALGEVALWDMASHRLIRKIALPEVTQAVMLPGSGLLSAGTTTGHLVLIDAETGIVLHRIRPHEGAVLDMALSPDGASLATTDGALIRRWALADGQAGPAIVYPAQKIRFAGDSAALDAGTIRGGLARFGLDGTPLADQPEGPPLEFGGGPYNGAVTNMALGPDGVLAVVRSALEQQPDGFYAEVNQIEITTEDGRRSLTVTKGITMLLSIDISDDGRTLAYAGLRDEDFSVVLETRDTATGDVTFTQTLSREDPGDGIARYMFSVDRLAFVPGTGRLVLIGAEGYAIVEYDPVQGKMTGAFGEPLVEGFPNFTRPQGTGFYVSDGASKLWAWDLAEGRLTGAVPLGTSISSEQMSDAQGDILTLFDALDDTQAVRIDLGTLTAREPTPDERQQALDRIIALGGELPVSPYAAALERLPGGGIGAVTLAEGRMAVESEGVGLHRAYDLATGELLVQFLATPDGEWLMLTPEGFFAASANGARLVSVSSGLRAFSVDQVYQALYRPDLVQAKLAGDPEGLVAEAARGLNLGLILQTGPAPRTRFSLPLEGARAVDEVIEVSAELVDEGGGVGRVEWRVNGLTVDVQTRAAEAMEDSPEGPVVRTRVALEPGQNVIEIVAYNAAGLLASAPQTLTVTWDGVASLVPPTLHVLSVGVNDYADGRLKLNYAAADAKALAAALQKAGEGLFSGVNVVTLLDAEVTEANLDAAFTAMGEQVKPQDVFLFFLAGHGKTVEGKYYFIPQDFRFVGDNPIVTGGINQDRWQEWAARVKARKSVMIYDTCESGSLTDTRSVDAAMAQSAAVERLTRAMGRTILSASTDDAPALEGYKGHGVLTYALLDALDAGDTNGNATIEVTELAGYIDQMVPEFSSTAFGFRQVPQMSIKGSDFALGARVAVLGGAQAERFPATLTHVVAGGTPVADGPGGAQVMVIDAGVFFGVHRIEEADGWARVAKDGAALGWVPVAALVPLQ